MSKPRPPERRDRVKAELLTLQRHMTLHAAVKERFPPSKLMDKAEELLDAQKLVSSREGGCVAMPDNPVQLGVLKLLCDHYNLHETQPIQSPPGSTPDDIFRSPSVLAAAKKLIEQQEREIERLQTLAPQAAHE